MNVTIEIKYKIGECLKNRFYLLYTIGKNYASRKKFNLSHQTGADTWSNIGGGGGKPIIQIRLHNIPHCFRTKYHCPLKYWGGGGGHGTLDSLLLRSSSSSWLETFFVHFLGVLILFNDMMYFLTWLVWCFVTLKLILSISIAIDILCDYRILIFLFEPDCL